MGTLIKGGKVVSAKETKLADVLIEGEKIARVAPEIDAGGHTVVDAKGMLVLPGGIDVHTHMEMPFGGTFSADTFETGTRAAAWGGTTTIVDFAVPFSPRTSTPPMPGSTTQRMSANAMASSPPGASGSPPSTAGNGYS